MLHVAACDPELFVQNPRPATRYRADRIGGAKIQADTGSFWRLAARRSRSSSRGTTANRWAIFGSFFRCDEGPRSDIDFLANPRCTRVAAPLALVHHEVGDPTPAIGGDPPVRRETYGSFVGVDHEWVTLGSYVGPGERLDVGVQESR